MDYDATRSSAAFGLGLSLQAARDADDRDRAVEALVREVDALLARYGTTAPFVTAPLKAAVERVRGLTN